MNIKIMKGSLFHRARNLTGREENLRFRSKGSKDLSQSHSSGMFNLATCNFLVITMLNKILIIEQSAMAIES